MLAIAVPDAAASPSQELDRARQAYRAKDWQTSKPLLNDLLYPDERLSQPQDLVEAYVLLGATCVELSETERAKREFKKALQLQPDRELGDLLFTESVIRIFNETRKEIEADNKRLEDAKRVQDQLDQIKAYRDSLVFYENHPYYLNFVPFGAGQFQNGNKLRGALLATGQGLTLAASAGIWGYLVNTYGINCPSCVKADDAAFVRRLQQIQIGTGIAFLGLYAYGVIDALLHHKAQALVKGDESLIPELDPKKTTPKKMSLRDRIRFSPMITPDGVGIGLGWEN
ncbi:MAG: hypothetical protein H0T79_06805 [Deltaproteobacteria bacterium]|nr:hypothetical protein [Deltaproteobacteria bacterium]